jgi:O-antigen ligase
MRSGELKIPPTRPSFFATAAPGRFERGPALVAIAVAAIIGFVLTAEISSLPLHHPHVSGALIILFITLVPLAFLTSASALPQLWRKLRALKYQLRWWHGLWILLYLSTLVFRKREATVAQEQPLDAWALFRLLPEMIVLLVLCVQLLRKRPGWLPYLFRGLLLAVTLYGLACAASAVWSVFPAWTLYKSLEFLLDLSVLAAALANIETLEQYKVLFDCALTIYAVELVWVWMQWPLFPSEVFEDSRLKGLYPATAWNAVGESGAILAAIALCRLLPLSGRRSDRSFYGLLFAFGISSLLLSQTRSAVAGLAVGVIMTLILSRRIWQAVLMGALSGVAWFFTGAGATIITYLQRDQSESAMRNLTGRMDLWTYAWQQWTMHPFTGSGAYAAGRFAVMSKVGFDATTLHSDWMEMLVGIGLLGLIPFVIALAGAGWSLLRSVHSRLFAPDERQLAYESAVLLSVMVVHSFFNTELSFHAPLAFFAVFGCAELLRRNRKLLAERSFRPVQPVFEPALITNF